MTALRFGQFFSVPQECRCQSHPVESFARLGSWFHAQQHTPVYGSGVCFCFGTVAIADALREESFRSRSAEENEIPRRGCTETVDF